MFVFEGKHLYTEEELKKADALEHYIRVPGTDLFVSKGLQRQTVVDHSLTVYDWAVPQAWWEEQYRRTGKAPDAVWCYDGDAHIFGKPVFFDDLWFRWGKDAMAAILNGRIRFQEAD